MKIIHLHGFASVGTGAKYDALVKEFGRDNIVSPDLPVNPDDVEAMIDEEVKCIKLDGGDTLVFAGTSLGGFWANYFAQKYKTHCVIVNPSMSPSQNMLFVRGMTMCNFATGMPFTIPFDIVQSFQKRENFLEDNTDGKRIHLFVARDDNILDYKVTLRQTPQTGSTNIFDDGGHRFEMHWGAVIAKLKELVTK